MSRSGDGDSARSADSVSMRSDSAYGSYRRSMRSPLGRLMMAVLVVVVLAVTGTALPIALGIGAVVAFGALVKFALNTRNL